MDTFTTIMGRVPTGQRREDQLIDLFLSEYRDGAWKNSERRRPDQEHDNGVDMIATLAGDRTLAIEHTLIEPFVGERSEFARFEAFLRIEDDIALLRPGHAIYIDVPREALRTGLKQRSVAAQVNEWLRAHLQAISARQTVADVPVDLLGKGTINLRLNIRIVPLGADHSGMVIVRRYGQTDVGGAVEKALSAKLPKLVATRCDVRILLLERAQMTLPETDIWREIKARVKTFPLLKATNEIWFAETMGYDVSDRPGSEEYLRFENYDGRDNLIASMEFQRGALIAKSRNGRPIHVSRAR